MPRLRLFLALCLVVFSLNSLANDSPILQLNTGGHSALINDIVFTPDGRYLVSASFSLIQWQ